MYTVSFFALDIHKEMVAIKKLIEEKLITTTARTLAKCLLLQFEIEQSLESQCRAIMSFAGAI